MTTSFPGMPFLTYRTTNRLHKYAPAATFHLEREVDRDRVTTDAEVYTAYIDDRPIGRFTIRRTGWQMERVYFCKLPNPPNVPAAAVYEGVFSAAGTVVDDAVRIGWETLRLWLYYLSGGSKTLWKYSPWQGLDYERGRDGRISLLGTMVCFPDIAIRHDFCDIDGNPFVAANADSCTYGSTEPYDLDVGGYCAECDKNLCPDHVAFASMPDPRIPDLECSRLVCAKHQQLINFERPSVEDQQLKKLEELATFIARVAQEYKDRDA